jgi:hypothetical protein
MHPEIKKFWVNAGYSISQTPINDTIYYYINIIECVGYCDNGINEQFHFINGNWYNERQALKIVKMKAFM